MFKLIECDKNGGRNNRYVTYKNRKRKEGKK